MRSYELPGEDKAFEYPASLAPPLQILIDASNGASDYGNKFGEPLVAGYTRTFGQRLPGGERREWIKPIMFRCAGWGCGRQGWAAGLKAEGHSEGAARQRARRATRAAPQAPGARRSRSPPLSPPAPPLCRLACCSAGLGQIDHEHLYKNDPELGMLVVKIGGPAYRIGMGGGAASSVPSGSNSADLDFNAVQVRRLPALGAMCSGGACACRRADAAGTWTGTRAAHSRECLLRMPAAPVRPRSAATPR